MNTRTTMWAAFRFDNDDPESPILIGWDDGERWNGAAVPILTRESSERAAAYIQASSPATGGDHYTYGWVGDAFRITRWSDLPWASDWESEDAEPIEVSTGRIGYKWPNGWMFVRV